MNIEKTALVVIDLQNGIVSRPCTPHTTTQVVNNASKLVDVFTQNGAFVVLVRVSSVDGKDMLHPITDLKSGPMQPPEGWDRLVPELQNHKDVYCIIKRQWGAFFGTDLELQLRRRGIDTIVLCGISTEAGVDTTAREAFQRGFNQIFVEDAMTSMAKDAHDFVCKNIFPRMGQIRSTEEVVSLFESPITQNT